MRVEKMIEIEIQAFCKYGFPFIRRKFYIGIVFRRVFCVPVVTRSYVLCACCYSFIYRVFGVPVATRSYVVSVCVTVTG